MGKYFERNTKKKYMSKTNLLKIYIFCKIPLMKHIFYKFKISMKNLCLTYSNARLVLLKLNVIKISDNLFKILRNKIHHRSNTALFFYILSLELKQNN